jgi:amino acid adenylation domain-containing protein/non-ribosomal peptide synthase protein (TIGR01720 family)
MEILDLYELSSMQQGMLFHTLYAPESGVYFEQRRCRLTGNLNLPAFQQAWQQVVDRHAVLRTAFNWEASDKPLQIVFTTAALPWLIEDWQTLPADLQVEKLAAFCAHDRRQGFDLTQAPLMRMALFRVAPNAYDFVWSHHHLLMDGWCNALLLQEVLTLYQAACQGRSLTLPSAPPYRDYILWLQQQDQTAAETFWRQTLQGFTQPTQLSTQLGIDTKSSTTPDTDRTLDRHLTLDADLTAALHTLAQQHRFTLSTLFQGAWAWLLSRHSNSRDIVFGATVSGRPPSLPRVEAIVGLFINTVPIRVQIAPQVTVVQWLQHLQTQYLDRDPYIYSSLTDIQQWSDLPAGLPLFESLLVFENYPTSLDSLLASLQQTSPDLHISQSEGFERTNYPLTLTVIPNPQLTLQLSYNPDRFTETDITRLLDHLHLTLSAIATQPHQLVAALPPIPPSDQRQLTTWNHSPTLPSHPTPHLIPVHHRFTQQANQTPAAIALVQNDRHLTYAQLNARANQVAHYLHHTLTPHSRSPHPLIALSLPRSPEQIISLLGILKAGFAYLPIDPDLPAERRCLILDDAQVCGGIDTETDWQQIATYPETDPEISDDPAALDRLAYVIYTSGSTGTPKGVLVPHRGLAHYTHCVGREFELTPNDRVLQFASISFDAAAEEIFPTLIHGATLVLRTDAWLTSPADFLRHCTQSRLTILNLATAYWHQLLTQYPHPFPAQLRIVNFGGEATTPAAVQQWFTWVGDRIRLFNTYGPTEATIVSLWQDLTHWRHTHPDLDTIPIGRPIPQTSAYILDDRLQPLPIGVPGELYLAGPGITQGYLNRPHLTAAKFRPNPHSPTPSSTLYQTGDRARHLPDGTIDYLGRLDSQIKLRGYRIEPGEIEARLCDHPAIQTAIVQLHDGSQSDPSDRLLIAYLVARTATLPSDAEIYQWLSRSLPHYMLPSRFCWLDTLPLTPTGKVDRSALPPAHALPAPHSTPSTLLTPTADLLAGIWREVLQLDSLPPNANFFAIGGHSLSATQVMARIQQVFGIELPLRRLFDLPTLTELAQEIATYRLGQSGDRIPPGDRPAPLSFAQQRLWFLAQLEPENPAYNLAAAVQLTGRLNIAALRQSFACLVQRHEPLRTAFPSLEGQPQQQVLPDLELAIPLIDLSALPPTQSQSAIAQLATATAQQPFALATAPLMRVHLLRETATEHCLLITLHHSIADGWSLGILVQELTTVYRALTQAQPLSLPPLPIQYADFAQWQRQQTDLLTQQLTYWQAQLQDAPPLLELPTDYPRPAVLSGQGERYDFTLSPSLTAALQRWSQSCGCTLFMTLLAAWQILLHRYSGSDDIVIGTAIANRDRAELEGLIGFFVNLLPLRFKLTGQPTVEDLMVQVREVTLDGYAHQNVPFEQIVDALGVARSLSYTPVFQVLLVLQNAPMSSVTLEELAWTPLPNPNQTAKFDLTLSVTEVATASETHLDASLEYRSDLFTAATIARMAGHLETLLTAMIDQPDCPISHLPLLTAAEMAMQQQWQQGPIVQFPAASVQQAFEQQVERTPDAIALVDQADHFTYAELNRRANQLAHTLQQRGIFSGSVIGICLEPSVALLVSVLAVLKANAAYLYLNPDYPDERLNFMVQDASVAAVLTTARLQRDFGPVWQLDPEPAAISSTRSDNLPHPHESDALAYITYTSGSTGTPKGVCTPHRGILRLVSDCTYADLSPAETVLQAAPLSFDAATFEIWGAWLNGGRLVLLPQQPPALAELAQIIQQQQITTLWLTAGLFHLMVDEQIACFRTVRQLLAGGDVLSPSHVHSFLQAHPHCQLINGYGPTETTTFACCYPIPPAHPSDTPIPIGRPIANTQAYILDAHLQPVPIGIPGELYLGGDGLAWGYLDRPTLTAAQFLPNPHFSLTLPHSSTLYRTGDRARYLPDGTIDYLGRRDTQVKIRGFRVELAEIETGLNQHPAVQTAVVVVQSEQSHARLIAYLVLQPDTQTPDFRAFLSQTLPDYLIPAAFVPIAHLPLTANGKVDRQNLPAVPMTTGAPTAPTTAIEEQLLDLWKTLLRLDRLGIHDNFFELGGDSILAIQLVSRAQQAGIQITPRQLFQHQTIAQLAAVAQVSETDSETPIATQGLVTGAVPLTPIQHWFFNQALPNPHHYNQAVQLEVKQPLNPHWLRQAIASLLSHHDALRLRFELTGTGTDTGTDTEWQQFHATDPAAAASCIHIDLTALPVTAQTQAIARLTPSLQRSLHLATGPLFRVAWLQTSADTSQLLLIAHHLVVDSVSWRILLADLHRLYQQLSQGLPPQLPAKTTAFQQWAEFLQSLPPANPEEIAYWRSQSRTTPLPVDYPEGSNTVATTAQTGFTLSVADTQALLHTVPQIYNTQITDILLTALVQAIAAWTGQPTLRLDLEAYGRDAETLNLSRTVGWFTALFPVWLDLGDAADPGTALKRIKEQLRRPYPSRNYGIQRYLQADSPLADLPAADLSFNYLGQFASLLAETPLFELAPTPVATQDSIAPRSHRLELIAAIKADQLEITCLYSHAQYDSATLTSLLDRYHSALRALIAHCQEPTAGGRTPSDYPLTRLTQPHLDRLLTSLTPPSPPPPAPPADLYPLTPLQQGMVFHSLYAPASGVYVIQVSLELHGALNLDRFVQAWQQVIDRHAVLRTAFVWDALEQPLQVVWRSVPLPLTQLDWRSLPTAQQQAQLAELRQQQQQQGFDLTLAPLMHLTLIQTAADRHQLLWSYHHLLLDGWSMPLILQDLLTHYHLSEKSQAVRVPRPFRDYIAWLQQQDTIAAESFWRQYLAGFTAPTPFQVDRTVTAGTGAYQAQALVLSPAVTSALQTFAKQHQLTLSTLIQAAFARVLGEYSGETDVVFGVTCSGRPASLTGAEAIVGLLINTLPLRVRLDPQQPLIAWLQQFQQDFTEIRQFEFTPLLQIQRWSEVPKGISLFESVVVFENYPVDPAAKATIAGFSLGAIETTEQNNFPLSLYASVEDSLTLRLLYTDDRFDPDTITRMLGHLETVLTAMSTQSPKSVLDLPLLTAAEQSQLARWSQSPQTLEPLDESSLGIHQWFEAQTTRTPDAIAVVAADQQITYHFLNQRANQLAHYLRHLGVSTETRVGICLERSIDALTSLLAVLKAGGTYIPLDPTYPAQRLEWMVANAEISLLLTHSDRHPAVATPICLDRDWDKITTAPSTNLNRPIHPEQLAYILYTSGSTGTPKGVQIPHRALANFLAAMRHTPGLSAADIVCSVTTLSFDIAALELYLPLTIGARLVIADRSTRLDSHQLASLLNQQQITLMQATPALWNLLVASGWSGKPDLTILCGGEALDRSLAQALQSRSRALWNLYGPTETTIWSAIYPVQTTPTTPTTPIGRPIANTQLYIVNSILQPVPIGVPGHLLIGGTGLARGYLSNPLLTAEKFLPRPPIHPPTHPSIHPSTLYCTNDRARYLPDGTIEFLGRRDSQIKLRGFRIEPGEIEATLMQHPQVQTAVVIVDPETLDRLIAYIVPDLAQATPTPADLRQFLLPLLPSHLLPAAYVLLEQLPLTPNGKLDRRALPSPDASQHSAIAGRNSLPQTQIEQAIAQIWRQLLRLETVGLHDNFFDLGGHSLLLIQLHSQLRDQFATDLSLVDLFRYPTIAAIAGYLSASPVAPAPDRRLDQLAAGKARLKQRRQQRSTPNQP